MPAWWVTLQASWKSVDLDGRLLKSERHSCQMSSLTCFTRAGFLTSITLLLQSMFHRRGAWQATLTRSDSTHSVCVCVCSLGAVVFFVAFEPHTINMSLWWSRGASGMLTCGGAALTTIDKELDGFGHQDSWWGKQHRRPIDFYIWGWCQFPFWLKSLTRACYLFTLDCGGATNHSFVYCMTDLLLLAKNALNHHLPASETNTELHSQIKWDFMNVTPYLFMPRRNTLTVSMKSFNLTFCWIWPTINFI